MKKSQRPGVGQEHVGRTPFYPVMILNGTINYDLARSPGAFGRRAVTIAQHRAYTNLGYNDVQLHNGLGGGVASGHKFPYFAQMYVWNFIPRIPGQTRGDAAGFHKRGPSNYNLEDWILNGPGSQPEHPGGPGQVVGSNVVYNPMSG